MQKKVNETITFDAIENMEHDETYILDSFLEKLSIREFDYIHAIQCTMKRRKILLKRGLIDTWNNKFDRHIPLIWG